MVVMCEIYDEPCKLCGRPIEMHLGDFKTLRIEIAVICPDHQPLYYIDDCHDDEPFAGDLLNLKYQNYCEWKTENGTITVIALTKNAWLQREENYPNEECVLLNAFKHDTLIRRIKRKMQDIACVLWWFRFNRRMERDLRKIEEENDIREAKEGERE